MVAKCKTVVAFGLALGLRVSKVSTVTGIGGSWSRSAKLSSLLDSRGVFALQKCQQSQGSGGSWSPKAELSSLLDLRLVLVSTVTLMAGVVVAKCRIVVRFGVAWRLRISKVSTVTGIGGSWSRNAEFSSLLDLRLVFASQECQQSQGSGGRGREAQNCHCWTCV